MQTRNNILLTAISVVLMGLCLSGCHKKENPPNSEWALVPFMKIDSVNPILTAGKNNFTCPVSHAAVFWDAKDVFNPAAVVREGEIFLLFRAEDTVGKYAGTSRIGLARSKDGLHFTKMKEPVLFPDNDFMKIYEWEGGIEDPRVVETEDGRYIMTYTAYDGSLARLCIASSPDLITWTKHGLALQEKYKNRWSKSGAIVARPDGEKIIAVQIDRKYWMYWGDTDLFLAYSSDLIHWNALEENDSLKSVLKPRPGYFDSRLVESGPYALQTDKGILLLYNGMNSETAPDSTIAKGAYCSGQVLFDQRNPAVVISRLDRNFLMPDKRYEIEGQVNQVCFSEGMVFFRGSWFLYYGTADSRIAVATSNTRINPMGH